MKTSDAIRYFGNRTRIAKTLRISRAAVSQWGDLVPLPSAARLEKLTFGALALEIADYDRPTDAQIA